METCKLNCPLKLMYRNMHTIYYVVAYTQNVLHYSALVSNDTVIHTFIIHDMFCVYILFDFLHSI